jgi:hypothetical protein
MPVIRFLCPSCGVTLQLDHPAPEGKKMRCPRCKTVSPVQAARPVPPPRPAAPAKAVPPPPPPKAPPAAAPKPPPPPVEEEEFDPILEDEPEPEEALPAPPPSPIKADERGVTEAAPPPRGAPQPFRDAPPPKGRKKGLDVVPILVGLVVCAYLGAATESFFGLFDGEKPGAPAGAP